MNTVGRLSIVSTSLLVLVGCKDEGPTAATFQHKDLGVVGADHPEYLKAYNLCDERVYGKGFEVNGVIYTSKSGVFEQIRPLLSKSNKSQADTDTLVRWSGEVQPSFIQCVEKEGFTFVKSDG